MRGLLLLLAGCTASVEGMPIDASPDSAPAPDSVAMVPVCPANPALSICLPFDADPLAAQEMNQGTVPIAAILTNVRRTAGPTGGGAALLGATSEISIPPNSAITGVVQIEATVRLDEEVPVGGRVGIVDVDNSVPGMSLFIYAGTTTPHRVRCNVGGEDVYGDTTIPLGAWVQLSCTCEDGNVIVRVDGVKLGELAGCEPASGTTMGVQIGQNSRAREGLPPNEPLVGAIDRLRLWTSVQ